MGSFCPTIVVATARPFRPMFSFVDKAAAAAYALNMVRSLPLGFFAVRLLGLDFFFAESGRGTYRSGGWILMPLPMRMVTMAVRLLEECKSNAHAVDEAGTSETYTKMSTGEVCCIYPLSFCPDAGVTEDH
jgi:hypothetical protein